ncbi:methyltransferase domain-containing protein [Natronomonas sp. EA1]|uniref:methyltransferase domain-containing protein n=1 Tax=Natronomonas sp. EA1 TaxID=3421655 RepID=UPI003EB8758A
MSVLLVRPDREYLVEPGSRLESDLGILEVPEDVQPGDVLESHIGEQFHVRKPRGPDLFDHLDRTGAPMMPRDIGLIIGHTGLSSGDHVLDAGTGTGVLSAYLGRLGVQVTTYEQSEEFAENARQNMATAGVADTVEVRTGDITDELDDLSGFDTLTLDTADAADVVGHAPDLLVPGGYVAVYSPFIESTRACVEAAREAELSAVETLETIQRHMDFDERGSRPSTAGVGHTGYLTFARYDPV